MRGKLCDPSISYLVIAGEAKQSLLFTAYREIAAESRNGIPRNDALNVKIMSYIRHFN
jgi:hypothetical protein